MKRLLLIISSILTLTACSNEGFPVHKENKAIAFSNVSTRAGVDDLKATGFGVWAGMYDVDVTTYTPILTDEEVKFDSTLGWYYTNIRYWLDNCHFYFLASYPRDVKFEEKKGYMEEENLVYYTLDVATSANSSRDIIIAYNHVYATENYSQPVSLTFNHLLTKVNIKIKQDFEKDKDNDYIIKKVSITGIKSEGQLMLFPIPTEEDTPILAEWADINNSVNLEKTFDTPINLRELGSNGAQLIWEDGLLLIPQEVVGVKVRVDYVFHYANSEEAGEERWVEGTLPRTTWQSGNMITYLMAISEKHDITFTAPTIEPWGAPQASGTIIIK